MPTLNIEGRRVKVGDDFLKLSPEQQQATVEEIARSLGVAQESTVSQNLRGELSALTQRSGADRGDSAGRNVDSFMRGAADMMSFGLADEISAGMGALTGIGGTFGDYSGNLRRQRITQEIRDRNDPYASTAGRVAGAVTGGVGMAKIGLSPTANLAADASLGAKIGAGALEGAVYGGAYGLGSGEGATDRLKQGAGGAVAGGLIGGAVPIAVEGVKAITKPFRDAISARVHPDAFAARKVTERMTAAGVDPETMARRMEANPGMTPADLGGESGRGLLRTTVNIPGPAKDRVSKQLTLRQFGQGDRLKTAIGRTFADPDGYLNAKDELADAARKVAGPLYERAYSKPTHFSETLEEILTTPAGKRALARAQELAANEQQPFRQIFINIRGQARRVPDTRGWDYIKRALDDMIGEQTDAITRKMSNEGRILTGLKNRMLGEIDRFNPDYKAARQAFSGIAQIDDAMEFGRKALGMSPEAVRREIAGMGASQKEAARVGAAEELRKAIDGAGYTNNAVLKVMNSRQRYQNLRALFDDEGQFATFRKAIFNEARKRRTYDAVKGNSTTAAQLADMMESGGTQALDTVARAATTGVGSATLQWLGSRLKMLGGMTPEVADRIAKRLLATDPATARGVVNEMMRIQSAQIAAAQKSQMIQSVVTKALTSQAVPAMTAQ